MAEKPRILGRFIVLSGLGVLGAIFFVPSIIASTNPHPPTAQLLLFVFVVSAVCILSSWVGLRFADAVHLPMPYLRRLDLYSEHERGNGALLAATFGFLFALSAIFVLHHFHQPNLAGPLWSRIASVFFAAGSLEIVVHLMIMSIAVRLARGRIWFGILVAAVFFVGFHVAGLTGQSPALITSSILLNGIFGLGLGLLYARYGFESVLLCHAVGHLLAVTLA